MTLNFTAQTIWEIGSKTDNPSDFAMQVDESDLQVFGFSDEFVFDLWGAINDAKKGRLANKAPTEFNEHQPVLLSLSCCCPD